MLNAFLQFRSTDPTIATDFLFGESVNSLLPNSPPREAQFYRDFARGTGKREILATGYASSLISI